MVVSMKPLKAILSTFYEKVWNKTFITDSFFWRDIALVEK